MQVLTVEFQNKTNESSLIFFFTYFTIIFKFFLQDHKLEFFTN